MSIASDAPAEHMPSVMRSASLHRKIRGRCVRSSVSSPAGSYGKRRKVSITISLRRHARNRAGERESCERLSRGYQEILRVEAATPRTARSGGVSEMLHRTTVRRADLIEGTVSAGLGDRTASDLSPRERAEAPQRMLHAVLDRMKCKAEHCAEKRACEAVANARHVDEGVNEKRFDDRIGEEEQRRRRAVNEGLADDECRANRPGIEHRGGNADDLSEALR